MVPDEDEKQAIDVAAMLRTGAGSFDWSALPLACRFYGVRDIEMLIDRLMVMKTYSRETK